ncbi:MAG: dTDP-Rha:a-D-GlcNAc-diphosphoryl polyprenol, a-3-L-rhamnosyl transferase [Acidimicrobiales bacterium]|nr:dTDP-Rha:a-D-GlcNAc-diphosphoryl polyprenol, a-3-L-rhamnosyl transferase [Acidimicrobiales bacterium]
MTAIAAVIVNYRTPELAEACAASVDVPADILVVDSASADGSVEWLRGNGLRVLERGRNEGFAAAVNDGFRHTTAPIVIVLNADAQCRPEAIGALTSQLEANPRAGIAAPRLLDRDGAAQPTAYRRFPGPITLLAELCAPVGYLFAKVPALDWYRLPPARWRHGERVAHVQGAALAIRRSAWQDTGGLDDRFFLYLEETEWQARLASRGWTVDLVPAAEVLHLGRSGQPAGAPPVAFLVSAETYLILRGTPPSVARTIIGAGVASSRLGLRMLGVLGPRGAQSRRVARDWDRLWREWQAEIKRLASATAARAT